MFYINTPYGEMPIEEIYARCFNCGKEIEVDSEMLLEVLKDGDLATTQISCCFDQRPTLIRIK